MNTTTLFTGTSNTQLAIQIGICLNQKLERTDVNKFSDGEIRIEVLDNVRGSTAFIIQSTCAPTNDTLMELLLLADALRRSSTMKIVAVIPYFGYGRQDRRPGYARVPISARVVADLIEAVKIDHVVTMDLHATQIQGFFKIPVDNLSPTRLIVNDVHLNYGNDDIVVVSPDVGGVARARSVVKYLNNVDLAIVDKRRPIANVSEVMHIIGDVVGKTCILVDDMVDTAGTLCKAADALIEIGGATKVVAYCTHGILSGLAATTIESSRLTELVITDTIPLRPNYVSSKTRVLSVADILAETINRIKNGYSVSEVLN
jgi:ribose-phosphate pyrophosphokinase